MLVALGTLAAAQTKGTTQTMDAAIQLLNYAATNPNATIRYHWSDMMPTAMPPTSVNLRPARVLVGTSILDTSTNRLTTRHPVAPSI